VATSQVIRHRLLSIVVLGVVVSALSLFALERALSTSMSVRRQKAHDIVIAEAERLAASTPSAAALQQQSLTAYVGVRGGWATSATDVASAPGLPASWTVTVGDAISECASTRARATRELDLPPNHLVVAAAPAASGGCAWAAYLVVPLASLQTWRFVTIALAIATALLVATAIWATLAFRRSAAALHARLIALGKDLTTPVPTPRAAELGGIAEGIRGLAADLLRSREATERLARELAQKERLAALGRVAAGVAHEVRNPLASIKLRLDLTTSGGELPESARKAVAAASDEIARLDRLVSDLLLVAGNKIGPRRSIDLGALTRARVEALQPWAVTRSVTLQAEGAGRADADEESVARALDNLLRNAVEASPAGAVVAARIAESDAAMVVHVEDRGAGIDPARAAELFEPFFTTKSEGTGLGLAISRAIARAHGGDVTYARDGAVTRFSLSMPRSQKQQAA
jgi:signal transduction histidine kinase